MTSAFHPQSDEQTERMNMTLEEVVLRHYTNPSHTAWESLLPWTLFAVNSTKHESHKTTPFELNYGWLPSTSFDVALRGNKHADPTRLLPEPASRSTALTAREARTALSLAHPDADSTVDLWRSRRGTSPDLWTCLVNPHLMYISCNIYLFIYLFMWRSRVSEARRCMQAAQSRSAKALCRHSPSTHTTPSWTQHLAFQQEHSDSYHSGTPKLLPRFLGPFRLLKMVGPVARSRPLDLSREPTLDVYLV
jgi:hypothetical protein